VNYAFADKRELITRRLRNNERKHSEWLAWGIAFNGAVTLTEDGRLVEDAGF
jgi:hypothetical protein